LQAGDFETAERVFRTIVEQEPAAHDAWLALALIAMHSGSPDLAVERARRAVDLDRKNARYLNSLGVAYGKVGDFAAAEKALRRALKLKPGYAEAHLNLARALHQQGRTAQSLKEYARAYAIDSSSPAMQASVLALYHEHGPSWTLAALRAAAGDSLPHPVLVPVFADCIADLDGPEAAAAWLRGVVDREPENRPARYALSLLLLSLGHWREGWMHHLWRTHVPAARSTPHILPPRLDGKRILLRAEQGLGDILFFLRFAAELRNRGAEPFLECPPKLAPLLAGRISIDLPAKPDLEIWIPDLAAVLQSDSTPPAVALDADDAARRSMRGKLALLGPPPYLGLTWRAGTVAQGRPAALDRQLLSKEVSPALLGEAVRGWRGTLLSLQRAPAVGELQAVRDASGAEVHDLSALNEDLREMLALLAQLDEHVAVSNTNIHLLAGLGGKARVLVPYPPEWRWTRSGDESPWFPGFTVYRQPASRDWSAVLARLRSDLASSAGSAPRAPA
jgi:cytochrome c-type biogenesis protein CcmH/NrfG